MESIVVYWLVLTSFTGSIAIVPGPFGSLESCQEASSAVEKHSTQCIPQDVQQDFDQVVEQMMDSLAKGLVSIQKTPTSARDGKTDQYEQEERRAMDRLFEVPNSRREKAIKDGEELKETFDKLTRPPNP